MKDSQLFPIGSLVVLIVILILVLVLPVKIPYNIDTKGYILPAKEWYLERTRDGSLLSTLKDNATEKVNSFRITEFQRGDIAGFELNHLLEQRGDFIFRGDTIGSLYSNDELRREAELSGLLAEYKAELEFYLAGSKQEEVEAALAKVQLAQERLRTDQLTYDRNLPLIEDSLIAPSEIELLEQRLKTHKSEVEIAQANYRALITGAKPEQIEWSIARINNIERQLEVLSSRMDAFTIKAPFDGVLHPKRVTNEQHYPVIGLADTSFYIVKMPVDITEKDYIFPGATVTASIPGFSDKPIGEVIRIEPGVNRVDGRQVFFVSAKFHAGEFNLMPGLLADMQIECEKVTPREFLYRSVKLIFAQ
ncbi:MAG: hypothetical protein EA412_04595 [Chitinophagaceae bacterium]|nr:MAG: hypothetical protein EA412_04595 [Chitinophagaceae bacterium]